MPMTASALPLHSWNTVVAVVSVASPALPSVWESFDAFGWILSL